MSSASLAVEIVTKLKHDRPEPAELAAFVFAETHELSPAEVAGVIATLALLATYCPEEIVQQFALIYEMNAND